MAEKKDEEYTAMKGRVFSKVGGDEERRGEGVVVGEQLDYVEAIIAIYL